MTDQLNIEPILHIERAVLRALCCGTASQAEGGEPTQAAASSALSEALRELGDYRWRGDEHRVVYSALAALKPSRGESVAEQLPAQATRMGFPDVDWKLYLESSATSQIEIRGLVRALKSSIDDATQIHE